MRTPMLVSRALNEGETACVQNQWCLGRATHDRTEYAPSGGFYIPGQ